MTQATHGSWGVRHPSRGPFSFDPDLLKRINAKFADGMRFQHVSRLTLVYAGQESGKELSILLISVLVARAGIPRRQSQSTHQRPWGHGSGANRLDTA